MQAELSQDAFDRTGADGVAGLAEFLANDLGGGVGVQEAVADDLLEDLVGAAIMSFGAALLVLEGEGASLGKGAAQLEVALFGEAKPEGSGLGAESSALALIEHDEFGEDGVVGGSGQLASGTGENQGLFGDFEHGRARIGERGEKV